jgi:osmotically-inducible protein OsmY
MTTDSDIKAELLERLAAIRSVDLAKIEIVIDNGKVRLDGRVDNYQTRSLIERWVRKALGVRGLELNISTYSNTSKVIPLS